MSAIETPAAAGVTSGELHLRGLKLPAPEPPKFSLTLKIFLAAALLILIAVGGAVAVSAYRARKVADNKIAFGNFKCLAADNACAAPLAGFGLCRRVKLAAKH